VLLKSLIVLGSWTLGYCGMKHLPLTLVGPINATRPVMVLLGAMLFFGERLNVWQWVGVLLAVVSFFMLSRSGRKEGIDFRHDRWIYCVVGAAVLGALSGLYDKYLMASPEAGGVGLNRMVVQSYYNFYQCLMLAPFVIPMMRRPGRQALHSEEQGMGLAGWNMFTVLNISLFLVMADFVYFYALSLDGAMVSIVSMVRRSSVVVSFLMGAWLFHERNLRSKAVDLALVLLGMVCLWIGSN
jgi:drug/metabolite transporter (DMT)-like permease